MTALDLLRQHGPMEARGLAFLMRKPLTQVYVELMPEYGKGLVSVVCSRRGNVRTREWKAVKT